VLIDLVRHPAQADSVIVRTNMAVNTAIIQIVVGNVMIYFVVYT
jgi:hypothetical protein